MISRLLPVVLVVVGWLLVTAAFAFWRGDPWTWAASIGALLIGAGAILFASEIGHRIEDRRRTWTSSED